MKTMLGKAFRDLRYPALWFGLGGVVYTGLVSNFFSSVRDNPAMDAFMKAYPKALIEAFGISDFASFTGFVGGEVLNIMWPLIMAVFAILAGSAVVAAEVDSGTIETWLSVPASRLVLLGAKLIALVTCVLAITVVTALTVLAMATRFGVELRAMGVVSMALEMAGLLLVVGLGTALLSSLLSERGKAAGIAGGLTVLMYIAFVISKLGSGWKWVENVSLFKLYEPQKALESGNLDLGALAIMAVLAVAAAIGALVVFQRRDAIA